MSEVYPIFRKNKKNYCNVKIIYEATSNDDLRLLEILSVFLPDRLIEVFRSSAFLMVSLDGLNLTGKTFCNPFNNSRYATNNPSFILFKTGFLYRVSAKHDKPVTVVNNTEETSLRFKPSIKEYVEHAPTAP